MKWQVWPVPNLSILSESLNIRFSQFMPYLKYVTPVFLIGCLTVAAITGFQLRDELAQIRSVDVSFLSSAVIAQGLVSLIIVVAWRKNLTFHGVGKVSWFESACHVGISGLGKYLPGKIAGSIVRGAAIYQKTGNAQSIVLASLIEQVALLHSGAIIVLVLATYKFAGVGCALGVSAILLSTLFLVRYLKGVVNWITTSIIKLKGQRWKEEPVNSVRQYAVLFIFFSATWCFTALAFYYCIAAFGLASAIQYLDVLLITALAFISGFLAVFAPGGIGVREGVMVSMLAPLVGITAAISVSILHRVISMLFDLGLGAFSLILQGTKYPDRG